MAELWDQLPDESVTLYTHFLAYRDLGPLRSVRKAYRRVMQHLEVQERGGKTEVPGSFWEVATRHRWRERAEAWDVRNLKTYGARVAPLYVRMLENTARRGAVAAAKYRPGDREWGDVLATVDTLAKALEPARKANALGGESEEARADAERAAAAVQSAPKRAEPLTAAEELAAVE